MATKGILRDPGWPTHPDPSTDHVYAIGSLSVNYNDLETQLLYFVQYYGDSSDEITAFLFEKVPTNVRIEWLKKAVALHENDPAVCSSIEHFISAYAICTENRGLLVHSRLMAHRLTESTLIASKRTRKTGKERYYEFSLDVIRRVADEIQFWRGYGGHINAYLNRRSLGGDKLPKGSRLIGPTTLPGKPSLPINLITSFS